MCLPAESIPTSFNLINGKIKTFFFLKKKNQTGIQRMYQNIVKIKVARSLRRKLQEVLTKDYVSQIHRKPVMIKMMKHIPCSSLGLRFIPEYLDEWKHINFQVMFSVSVSLSVFSILQFSFLLSLSTLDPFNLCCDVVSTTMLYYQMQLV